MTTSIHDVVLVGNSSPMKALRATIATVAPMKLPVLIEGPTGTGKELVAALLHQQSGRTGNMVAFNVCALGDSMFEDALFGHAKGAYTGAIGESLGFLREANGGTAFFDEISGLSVALQAKLLRAIETGVFRPIGAARDACSDFRPISATNESLTELVENGRFRADLMHRIGGIVLRIPSLGERVGDIPELARYFVRSAAGPNVSVTPDAITKLQETPWPGNVRQLRQVVGAAIAFSRGAVDARAIGIAISQRSSGSSSRRVSAELVKRRELVTALEGAEWDTERAASMLGLHRATIYRRIRRHDIELPSGRASNG